MDRKSAGLGAVLAYLNRSGLQINKLTVDNEEQSDAPSGRCLILRIQVKLKKVKKYEEVIAALVGMEGVVGFETLDMTA